MNFIAGPYRWSWGGETLGIVEDAPRIEFTLNGEPIRADLIGGNRIDDIYQGLTGSIDFVFQQFNAQGVLNAINGGASGVFGRWDDLGCSMLDRRSDVLWGQAIPSADCLYNLPGAGRHFLAFRAVISTGTPISFLMGGRLRQVPIRFNLLPYARENAGTGTMSGVETSASPIHIAELIDGDLERAPVKADAISLSDYLALVA